MIEELIRLCKLKELDFTISTEWNDGIKFSGQIEGRRGYNNGWPLHEDFSDLINSMCGWIQQVWANEIE